jgi:hypothetical protein
LVNIPVSSHNFSFSIFFITSSTTTTMLNRVFLFVLALAIVAVNAQQCQLKLHRHLSLTTWDESKSFCEAQGGPGSRLATWQEYCPNGQGSHPAFLHAPSNQEQEDFDHRAAPAFFDNGGRTLQPYAWASLDTCNLGIGLHFFAPPSTAVLADAIYCFECPTEEEEEYIAIDELTAVEEPTIEEPTIEEPTIKEPTIKEPTIKEPTIEEVPSETASESSDSSFLRGSASSANSVPAQESVASEEGTANLRGSQHHWSRQWF